MQTFTLSRRQREVLVGLANGLSNEQMARDMGISVHSVKTHLENLYKNLRVTGHGRAAAVGAGIRLGLISLWEVTLPGECPGHETVPNYCRCPCEGCKHNCAAHQRPEEMMWHGRRSA